MINKNDSRGAPTPTISRHYNIGEIQMSSKTYYVYRITNVIENKHYYGRRACDGNPRNDLGIRYFSSSKDKIFIKDQKQNPHKYKYKILLTTPVKEKAERLEISLHKRFNVAANPNFYNLAQARSNGFSVGGTAVAILVETGEKIKVCTGDPRFKSGEIIHHTKGMRFVKNVITGETKFVDKSDLMYKTEEWVSPAKGKVVVKYPNSNVCFQVSVDDPIYQNGEVIYYRTNTKHSDKTRQKMSKNGIKGHNVYHHPNTLEVRYFKDGDKIPDGFIKGQHEKFREEASEKFIGDAFYHDPKTGEQIRIKPGDTIPDGYVKGKNETFVGFAFNKTTYTLLDLKDRCYHRVPNEHILKDHQLIYSGHKLENIMIYLFDNKMFVGIHRLSKYLYNMCILPIHEKRTCPIQNGFIDTSRYKNKTKRRIDTLDDDTKYRLLKIYDKSHLREHVSIIPLLKFDWNNHSHIQLIG